MLGRAWSRLLIYPGGLAAFSIIWLVFNIGAGRKHRRTAPGHPAAPSLSAVVMPWLGLALLPLPLATALPRQTDLIVVVTLLEWPRMLLIARELQASAPIEHAIGKRRLMAALNGFPPFILAALALAQASGSFEVAALARAPGEFASASASVLHWFGAVALVLALPPTLGIGAFRAETPHVFPPRHAGYEEQDRLAVLALRALRGSVVQFFALGTLQLGLRLRDLGLVALAALPWAGEQAGVAPLLRMVGAICLIAGLLWGYDRLTVEHSARRWAWGCLIVAAALLLALLWGAYEALQSRIA
jgi:hypothetical protein